MNGSRSVQGRSSLRRRWAELSVASALAVGLSVGAAIPSSAAPSSPPSATHTVSATKKTVWRWIPLVQVPVASTKGSSSVDAAVHPQKHLVVKGTAYGSLLAGNVPAGGTGAATFNLGKHCKTFRTVIGLTDSSPRSASIAYSVYFGDVAEIAPTVKHGKTKSISLNVSGVSHLVLRNTEPDPSNAFSGSAVAAWPQARVLCSVNL